MNQEEQNKAVARRLVEEAFNLGKLGVLEEIVATNFVNHDPASPDFGRGPQAARQNITVYRTAFPDVSITIEEQVAAGDKVVTRWTGRGTHKGTLGDIPATGKQTTVTGITIDRLADGKIVESWSNWDTLGLMRQLGVVPAPGKAPGG